MGCRGLKGNGYEEPVLPLPVASAGLPLMWKLPYWLDRCVFYIHKCRHHRKVKYATMAQRDALTMPKPTS